MHIAKFYHSGQMPCLILFSLGTNATLLDCQGEAKLFGEQEHQYAVFSFKNNSSVIEEPMLKLQNAELRLKTI